MNPKIYKLNIEIYRTLSLTAESATLPLQLFSNDEISKDCFEFKKREQW